jgi:ABC-2 type transport system permease protein
MLNYMKAEIYRNFNRLYFWLYTGIFVAIALIVNIELKIKNVLGISLNALAEMSVVMLIVPLYLVIAFVDMVTAEEHKNLTLRNIVTFGLERIKLILSKQVVAIVLALISALIIGVVFYGSGALLLGIDYASKTEMINNFTKIAASIPLWIGAISVATFMSFLINNNTLFAFTYAGVLLLDSRIIKLLAILFWDKIANINKILITTHIKKLASASATGEDMINAVLVGVAYTIVFTLLSMIYFKRKEVK